jgi:hypothetical protein
MKLYILMIKIDQGSHRTNLDVIRVSLLKKDVLRVNSNLCVATEPLYYLVTRSLFSIFIISTTAELMSSFRELSDMSIEGNCKSEELDE